MRRFGYRRFQPGGRDCDGRGNGKRSWRRRGFDEARVFVVVESFDRFGGTLAL